MSEFELWRGRIALRSRNFSCWLCTHTVASDQGFYREHPIEAIYICPHCGAPNYFNNQAQQIPGPTVGSHIDAVPENVQTAYDEARKAFSAGASTASVLMCRKILMNIAVNLKAEENKSFKYYVDWLHDNHFIPPNSKEWVDLIREKGNTATHEIPSLTPEEAKELIIFCEMILRIVYEFPSRAKKKEK